MNDFDYNKMGYAKLTEGGLNRIMSHGKEGMVIISGCRSEIASDNPKLSLESQFIEWIEANGHKDEIDKYKVKWLKARNKVADKKLLELIKDSGYTYSPVYGGYHGSDNVEDSFEPSYIVYNRKRDAKEIPDFSILYNMALEWCRKFGQDSVYVQPPRLAPIYVNGDGEKVNSKESLNFQFNRENTYYTTAKREKTNPQKFTADIQFEGRMFCASAPGCMSIKRRIRESKGEVILDTTYDELFK